MKATTMTALLTHWENERCRFMAKADACANAGQPALQHLRAASRCEARLNKLTRLADTAAQARSAA